MLSFSAEDPAKDYQKRPRRWSTVALDVLSTRCASQQSVHFAKRMATSSPAAKLRSAGPCSHGIECHKNPRAARALKLRGFGLWLVDDTTTRWFWMAADACVPRRNAARWMHPRSCVMSRYSRDYAQRVRACSNKVCRTLSKHLTNNSLQREY